MEEKSAEGASDGRVPETFWGVFGLLELDLEKYPSLKRFRVGETWSKELTLRASNQLFNTCGIPSSYYEGICELVKAMEGIFTNVVNEYNYYDRILFYAAISVTNVPPPIAKAMSEAEFWEIIDGLKHMITKVHGFALFTDFEKAILVRYFTHLPRFEVTSKPLAPFFPEKFYDHTLGDYTDGVYKDIIHIAKFALESGGIVSRTKASGMRSMELLRSRLRERRSIPEEVSDPALLTKAFNIDCYPLGLFYERAKPREATPRAAEKRCLDDQ